MNNVNARRASCLSPAPSRPVAPVRPLNHGRTTYGSLELHQLRPRIASMRAAPTRLGVHAAPSAARSAAGSGGTRAPCRHGDRGSTAVPGSYPLPDARLGQPPPARGRVSPIAHRAYDPDMPTRQPARFLPAMGGQYPAPVAAQLNHPGRASVHSAPHLCAAPPAPVVEHQRASARNDGADLLGAPPPHAQHQSVGAWGLFAAASAHPQTAEHRAGATEAVLLANRCFSAPDGDQR
jgi:hypothetical protein